MLLRAFECAHKSGACILGATKLDSAEGRDAPGWCVRVWGGGCGCMLVCTEVVCDCAGVFPRRGGFARL